MITLAFHGAAGTVTGSKSLLTVGERKILIDCGMFQGAKSLRRRNWAPMPFDPAEIEAVVLTHAHIDHIGYLPRLVKDGFAGKVYATPPTIELAKILLLDSAHIQEEDAAYRNRKKATSHLPALPLFTTGDAEATFGRFAPVPFNQWRTPAAGIRFRYHPAGHIVGAGSVEVQADDGTRKTSVLFSGDVGRYSVPLVKEPASPPETDYIVCESTYGGEVHDPQDVFFELANLIDEIVKRRSILLIPAFAVGRTQQITYAVNTLARQGRIRPVPIHIDSPMAVRATDVYRRFPSYHAIKRGDLRRDKNVLYGKNIKLHRKRKSSKKLNRLKGPAIIMSASGMMTAGRVLHHLINRLPDERTTLLIVGFMAEGTIGRKILEGAKTVYIHKMPVEVKARVVKMTGLSAHADSYELMHWLEPLKSKPRRVFVTHGEPSRSEAMASEFRDKRGWDTHIPALDETVEL